MNKPQFFDMFLQYVEKTEIIRHILFLLLQTPLNASRASELDRTEKMSGGA